MTSREEILKYFIKVVFLWMGTQKEQVSFICSVRVRKLRFVDLWSDGAKPFLCSSPSLSGGYG